MSDKIKITVLGGGSDGKVFELELKSTLLVGRSHSADVRLKDADVSGKHFEFVRTDAGCFVRGLSRHGLELDGDSCGEGVLKPVRVGSTIALGATVKLRVDALPVVQVTEAPIPDAGDAGTDFFAADASVESETSGASADITSTAAGKSAASPFASTMADKTSTEPDDPSTRGDFEDALTEAGEGETQEMKTRVGSMEEIVERKRQLDRASIARRWRFGICIVLAALALGGAWFFISGTHRHGNDAEGPFLPNGERDVLSWYLLNAYGEQEIGVEYPRDDRMRVVDGTNSFEVTSYIGVDRDVPFHLEFSRTLDKGTIAYSLEDAFERRLIEDASSGMAFESRNGRRPTAEFFENAFPGWCEIKTLHGTRFMRTEFTRARNGDLWHGVFILFRRGNLVYTLHREVPEIYWKRAGYRVKDDLNLALFRPFLVGYWDSPGHTAMLSDTFTDNELLLRIRCELAAERVAAWQTLGRYIDTLLMRSWNDKPVLRQESYNLYRTFLKRLTRLYNERSFAFQTAATRRGNERQMRAIFRDVLMIFGEMDADRRSTLVKDPGVWTCP